MASKVASPVVPVDAGSVYRNREKDVHLKAVLTYYLFIATARACGFRVSATQAIPSVGEQSFASGFTSSGELSFTSGGEQKS